MVGLIFDRNKARLAVFLKIRTLNFVPVGRADRFKPETLKTESTQQMTASIFQKSLNRGEGGKQG